MYASCLWGFREASCSVPLTWLNEGNALGSWKEGLPGQLFQVPDVSFHVVCFLVAITFVYLENERRHFYGHRSPWRLDPRSRASAHPVSARSPGTRWKPPTPTGATFSRWKGKGTDLFPSHLSSRMQRAIIVPGEKFLLHWIFCLGFEVRSLGTSAPVIGSGSPCACIFNASSVSPLNISPFLK